MTQSAGHRTATALILVCLHALPSIATAQEKKVKILGLVDASAPLTVDYRTRGRRVRDTILAGGLLGVVIGIKEESKESKAFQTVVGEFDRQTVIESSLAAAFAAPSPYFEIVIPDNAGDYLSKKSKVDLEAVKAGGHKYVLVVREDMAGLITAWTMAHLSATSVLSYELYDVNNKKPIAKGAISGFAKPEYDFDTATTTRQHFVTDYPFALGGAIGTIYGQLYKDNHLNTMAQSEGLGDKVLPIGSVLDKYAGRFSYKFALPKGWEQVKMASKYSTALQPKNKDKMQFGINFTVDLLIEEFGQDVDDVDEYIAIFLGKVANTGYNVDSEKTYTPLKLDLEYKAYVVDRPGGAGNELLLFRRLSKDFVAIYSVVLLSDFDGLLGKYRKDIEAIINKAKVETES